MSEIREEKDKGTQERDALGALLESQRRQEALARRGLWHQRIRTGIAAVVAISILALAGTASATLHDVQILAGNASYAVSDLHATSSSSPATSRTPCVTFPLCSARWSCRRRSRASTRWSRTART